MELTIFSWISLLVALIGSIFVIRIFLMWNNIDKSMLKAKVYLDEKFLYNNWIYLFWIGTLIIFHQAITILYNSALPQFNTELGYISNIFEFASVVLIVIFCYRWYKLLNACTFKDK